MTEREGEKVNADFYYLKALEYLSSMEQEHSEDAQCTCAHCHSSEDEEDSASFFRGFRPGLTQDSPCGSGSLSASGLDDSSALRLEHAQTGAVSRKCAEREKSKSLESVECGKTTSRAKRKLSDGHVHWADEFQKELTRCHPRKTYTRHPSHMSSQQVKPILKAAGDSEPDCAQC